MRRRSSYRYVRPDGPICYELPVFQRPAAVGALLDSPLAWSWESGPRERPAPAGRRRLRRLDAVTRSRLLDDLAYRDRDGCGYFVAIYGLGAGATCGLDEASLRELLADFARARGGPLEIVIIQLGDTPDEYLFVGGEPSAAARQVLDDLGVGERHWREVPYGRLQLAALESIYEL